MKPGKRRALLAPRLLHPPPPMLRSNVFALAWWTPKKPTMTDVLLVSAGYVDGGLRWQSLDCKKHGVCPAVTRTGWLLRRPVGM
jgi:hypothetical protein